MITRFGSLRLPRLALILWLAALFAQTLPEIDMSRGAKVSMRDGAQVNAILGLHGQKNLLPVIFSEHLGPGNREGWAHRENDEYHSSALELSIVKP